MALARAQRDLEFQRTVELVNRFTLSTVQFLNRFSAMCEDKLQNAKRMLQHIEIQVKLLEVKLDSTDSDGEGAPPSKAAAPVPAIAAAPKPLAIGAPPPPPGMGVPRNAKEAPPVMNGMNGGSRQPPPPPGYAASKQPPLPPGASSQSAGGALAVMPPPQPPGQPPPGFMPPPPPMPMGVNINNLTRNHPRLVGYFKMQDAGVPVAAIKAKMQADGMNPVWLDSPDQTAPSGIPAPKNATLYDSD